MEQQFKQDLMCVNLGMSSSIYLCAFLHCVDNYNKYANVQTVHLWPCVIVVSDQIKFVYPGDFHSSAQQHLHKAGMLTAAVWLNLESHFMCKLFIITIIGHCLYNSSMYCTYFSSVLQGARKLLQTVQ